MNAAVSEAIMNDATEAEHDVFVGVTAKVEGMDQETLEQHIADLIENVDFTYFELGLSLSTYQDEGYWKNDYKSFRDAVEDKYGLAYRKAMYLMSISNSLVEAEIPWEKVAGIGWSKLKELATVLTKENVDEWVAKVMGPPPMTLLQVIEAVKAAKVGSLNKNEVPDDDVADTVTSLSFKVHLDQKENIKAAIDKAKGEAETEYDAVALDAICMNYLAGGNVKPKTLVSVFKAYQPEEVLEAFATVWPDIDVTAKM